MGVKVGDSLLDLALDSRCSEQPELKKYEKAEAELASGPLQLFL